MGACISNPENAARLRKERESQPHHHRHHRRRSSRQLIVLEDLSTGAIRESYSFGKELGRGEFGVTYLVTRVDSGERFACKTISKSKLRTAVDVEDVRREVEIMRRVPIHPNIVEYKEVYEDKDAVYLVMELCQGGELFDRITTRGRYTERAAAQVAKTILTVVQVCHEHGVIHRDLKPENFLYSNKDDDSPLKAIDFGLSIFFEEGQRFGEIVGSPYYMAPEVLKRNYGPEVDVWSAGVILYILLCGVPPFWAATEEGIAHAIVRGVIDFRRDPWPKVSPEAKDLVKRMLDPQPESRLTLHQVIEHPWLQNATRAPDVPLGTSVMSRIKQFTLMNKFKKKVLTVVADNLPEEQVEAIKSLFRMMDTDSSGTLSFDELKAGLVMLGHALADSDVQTILDAADSDGNGVLDCEEFLTMSIHIRRLGNDEHLFNAFHYFDKNESGFIEFDELKEALFENDIDPTNNQVIEDIVLDIDLDKDGRISYDEFKTAMNKGMDWKMASRQYSKAMLNTLSFKMFNGKSSKLQTS